MKNILQTLFYDIINIIGVVDVYPFVFQAKRRATATMSRKMA